ncbi:MAG: glycosyltransferase [Proteobacteria bacterium]|nr:glycosyltransferase [Pseudomonadota bacterium]
MTKLIHGLKHYKLWFIATFGLTILSFILTTLSFFKNKAFLLPKKAFSVLKNYFELKCFIKRCKTRKSAGIAFNGNEIDVSIIIPVFNQWHLTKACIESILATVDDSVNFELILADDGSTDNTINASKLYFGIKIIRSPKNQGFLLNCNNAAKAAKGHYILLLNNDTLVLDNWLSALYKIMEKDKNIAIAGSKMLYSTGFIQEAGSALFCDGSTRHLGKRYQRDNLLFNYLRETDYCSGCSIIIRKSFWDAVGGFDTRYQNAYYEDVDLALTARLHGMKVVYQPESEVIHLQHKSYSAFKRNKHKELIAKNKLIFLEKWQKVLSDYVEPKTPWPLVLSHAERSKIKEPALQPKRLNILFYSPRPTHQLNHGNRCRIYALAQKYRSAGHQVHFVMLERFTWGKKIKEKMQQQYETVDILPCKKLWFSAGKVPFDGWYSWGMGEQIYRLCKKYQIDVVLCSYIYQSKLLDYVPPYILKIIDTHEKMADRTKMLQRHKIVANKFSCTIEEEARYLKRADLVIGISKEESRYFSELLAKEDQVLTISHMPNPSFIPKVFSSLNHVGIVASNNQINIASFKACLRVLDAIEEEIPFVLHVAGDLNKSVKIRRKWLKFHGFLPSLTAFYEQMDLIISPMICGTGVNIKTIEAMAWGLPILATNIGSRGTFLNHSLHQQETIEQLIKSLFFVKQNPQTLELLAEISRSQYSAFYDDNENNFNHLLQHNKLNQYDLFPT